MSADLIFRSIASFGLGLLLTERHCHCEISLRSSAYLRGLCVEIVFKRRERRDTRRAAEKTVFVSFTPSRMRAHPR